MKAALLYGIRDLRLVEVPTPAPGPREVLVRVHACGICPTDLRKFNTLDGGRLELPMNLGHEYVGTVVQVGSEARGFEPGSRVMGEWYRGYAEYAVLRPFDDASVHNPDPLAIPDDVSDAAATFLEPLADCIHAIVDQAQARLGQTVLVIGGGTMGQLLSMVAKTAGARTILSEPDEGRRRAALSFGADAVVDPTAENVAEAVRRLNQGRLADAAVLAIGIPALVQTALETIRPRGRVVLFGGFPRPAKVELDPNRIHYEELVVTGSEWVGARPYWDCTLFRHALDLIRTRHVPVERLVSASYPLEQIDQAFAEAARMDKFKVIVTV